MNTVNELKIGEKATVVSIGCKGRAAQKDYRYGHYAGRGRHYA